MAGRAKPEGGAGRASAASVSAPSADAEPGERAAPATGHAAWMPLVRGHYFSAMVGAGVLTGILGFLPAVLPLSPLAELVPLYAGWLIVLAQAVGIAWMTGNLRPWPVAGGFFLGLWGMAVGYVGAMVVSLALWPGAEV